MKKPLSCLAICLVFAVPSLSMAWEGGGERHSSMYRRGGDQGDHGYHGGHDHHGWRGDRGRGWVPWVSAAVIGSGLYWANQQAYGQPTVTVITPLPPPVYLEAPRVAYFCQTSGQYYPYVPSCNMPWQLVSY